MDFTLVVLPAVTGALFVCLAAFVLSSNPRDARNVFLFAAFTLFGVYFLLVSANHATSEVAVSRLIVQFGFAAALPGIWLHIAFIGAALRPLTFLATPIGSMPFRALLISLAVASVFLPFVYPNWITQPVQAPESHWNWAIAPVYGHILTIVACFALYSAVCGFHAWFTAPQGSVRRQQALAYVFAFGAIDVGALLAILAQVAPSRIGVAYWPLIWLSRVLFFAAPILIGYALLKWQLFDIDLRLKFALGRGTIAATFLLVFFVGSQLAEAFAVRFIGGQGWVVGAVAAGLLLFALSPLQRLGRTVAEHAMPSVQDTAEYRVFRKHEVYRATVGEMFSDKRLTVKERRAMDRLRETLKIAPQVADRIESEIRQRMARK